ncbi:MAG TPA: M23 family metallopeptidase, partial [Aquificaceae bacterium]|nr:M23 family metallopeptidase [Aquificaceae bacterium]
VRKVIKKVGVNVEEVGWVERGSGAYIIEDNTYVALFGVPPTTSPREVIKVIATDGVGNRTVLSLGTGIRRNNFKRVKVELKEREKFLRPKLLAILGEEEKEGDFLKLFKKVNEDVRKENTEKIKEIGSGSAPERYWSGNFLQHKRSKVISRYGERRIYTYGGKLISRSWHLGYDLASVKNSEVLAANRGKVVFAGDLGIYGNTVIIDHGMGLMSLYSHLADFVVEEGDLVEKGQLIGFTDMTGLAFGDHLHFGVLVGGLEVTPLEWWDPKWVKNRIEPAFSG